MELGYILPKLSDCFQAFFSICWTAGANCRLYTVPGLVMYSVGPMVVVEDLASGQQRHFIGKDLIERIRYFYLPNYTSRRCTCVAVSCIDQAS